MPDVVRRFRLDEVNGLGFQSLVLIFSLLKSSEVLMSAFTDAGILEPRRMSRLTTPAAMMLRSLQKVNT